MAEHQHPKYMLIWFWLAVLTALEIAATQLSFLPNSLIYILLIGLAISKAILVALYFMHLRFERRTFVIVVSSPAILAILLVFMLLPDVGFR